MGKELENWEIRRQVESPDDRGRRNLTNGAENKKIHDNA